MEDIIVIFILFLILAGIARYFIRAKKRNVACITCPYADLCQGKCDTEASYALKSNEK